MTRCIEKRACPNCRSMGRDTRGDNLGVYEDGSTYCFSCGLPSKSRTRNINDIRTGSRKSNSGNVLWTPSDSVRSLGHRGQDWLTKYEISQEDFDIKWSEKKEALVFSFYNQQKELIFYQLRLFDGKSRWKSYGIKPLTFVGDSRSSVVLVEDIVSAIKVGKVACAVPLFGATIGTRRLTEIRKQTDNIKIWLDYDKANAKETKKIIASCKAIFKETSQIITEKDPKAYSTEEIKGRIG